MDPKVPAVALNKDDRGNYIATIYGTVAHWPKVNNPEPAMNEDKSAQMVKIDRQTRRPILKDGKEQPLWSWGVQLTVPKGAPGVDDLMNACKDVRKANLKGVGKITALKDGDKEADEKVEQGKDEKYQEWMRGQWVITAKSTGTLDRPPIIRNEIYGGAICVAVVQLATFDAGTNKGVKAYLQEIGRVAPGTRIEGGSRQSTIGDSVKFEEDAPKDPAPAQPAAASNDGMPWEE